MVTGFVVGSTFRLIDEFSPTLRLILAEVRKLNLQLDQARVNLAALGKFAMPAGRHKRPAFFMQRAPDVLSFELSSVQRNPLQAVISQDKVAQDFFGIADVL